MNIFVRLLDDSKTWLFLGNNNNCNFFSIYKKIIFPSLKYIKFGKII
jgi:hypothetical protein